MRSLCATPNRCSSSTMSRPRSLKWTSFDSSRCVPMTMFDLAVLEAGDGVVLLPLRLEAAHRARWSSGSRACALRTCGGAAGRAPSSGRGAPPACRSSPRGRRRGSPPRSCRSRRRRRRGGPSGAPLRGRRSRPRWPWPGRASPRKGTSPRTRGSRRRRWGTGGRAAPGARRRGAGARPPSCGPPSSRATSSSRTSSRRADRASAPRSRRRCTSGSGSAGRRAGTACRRRRTRRRGDRPSAPPPLCARARGSARCRARRGRRSRRPRACGGPPGTARATSGLLPLLLPVRATAEDLLLGDEHEPVGREHRPARQGPDDDLGDVRAAVRRAPFEPRGIERLEARAALDPLVTEERREPLGLRLRAGREEHAQSVLLPVRDASRERRERPLSSPWTRARTSPRAPGRSDRASPGRSRPRAFSHTAIDPAAALLAHDGRAMQRDHGALRELARRTSPSSA